MSEHRVIEDEDLEKIVATLKLAREAYYNGLPSGLTDAEYDALEDELRAIAPDHEVLRKVGSTPLPSSKWEKVTHGNPMGSLFKANTETEVASWIRDRRSALLDFSLTLPEEDRAAFQERVTNSKLILSEKLDGISLALVYEDGQLKRAVTRGDGSVGEDILRNVLLMQGLQPTQPGFSGWQRCEIVLRKSAHSEHASEYKNLRNAAAGIARRWSDNKKCKHLTVMHYQALRKGGKAIPNKTVEFKMFEARGCEVPFWRQCSGLADVLETYNEYIAKTRAELDYDIDGLVLEFEDPEFMELLGEQDGRPKGGLAFKFPPLLKETILRFIRWQVGSTGRVTPVAEFDPVFLIGAEVRQANLHNIDNIVKLGGDDGFLREGARILVSRANDVIPEVSGVKDNGDGDLFEVPTRCPDCNTELYRDGAYLRCPNTLKCPAQVAGAVERWVKKLDIKDVGKTLIRGLVEEGILSEPADLYRLKSGPLSAFQLNGKKVGSSMAKKIVFNVQSVKELTLAKFVGSLGIEMCSRSICEKIFMAGYDTLGKMERATEAELAQVPGIGDRKARCFVAGLRAKTPFINNLLDAGVKVKAPIVGGLSGSSVCFTGFRDRDLEKQVEALGGIMKTGVSKDLTILVANNPKGGSGKLAKARKYGLEIIGADDFRKKLAAL